MDGLGLAKLNVGLSCSWRTIMGYRLVDGDGLRTRYAAAPVIAVRGVTDEPVSIEVKFQAEPARTGEEALFTRLLFSGVLEYR